MNDGHLMFHIVLLLAAAVVFVPLTVRLGLGSVLGYLIAGVVIGPWGTGWIKETESLAHVSEMGVVFLLFIIGLELDPKRLWSWRMSIFGMGFLQVAVVSLVVALLTVSFGFPWATAIVVGWGAAMSSTAIATQVLKDRNLMSTSGGSSAFSVLLFQDIAVVPILASLPALAGVQSATSVSPLKLLAVLVGIGLVGVYLLRHILRLVAATHLREVFTALSLLLVIGLAALMQNLGVSMGLGAFLGGVLLATSEYRHAIEVDIDPFKGLLLGLFFMSVGMGIDLNVIAENPGTVLGITFLGIAIKLIVHSGLGLFFRVNRNEIPFFAGVISQVGEFSFVLFGTAATFGLLSAQANAMLFAAIALSMAITPLLIMAHDRVIAPFMTRRKDLEEEEIKNDEPEVIIAGFGRVGQIIGRILYANRIRATVLDHDPDQIEILRPFGFKVYYGDATRLDLLEAAGAKNAKALVVAVDNIADSLKIVDYAQANFPHLKLIVRARNMGHAYSLIDRGVEIWERETFESANKMGTEVLKVLGWSPNHAVRAGLKFREHNLKMIKDLAPQRSDRAVMLSAAKQAREDLERMFAEEKEGLKNRSDAWETTE